AKPAGVRLGAGHDEQVADGHQLAPGGPLDAHAVERVASQEPADFGPRVERDDRVLLDPLDEVAGHAVRGPASAHDDVYAASLAREEHGCLARGVPAAHHDDFLPRAELRLHLRGAVVDACALEPGELGKTQLAILDPGRDHHGARLDLATSRQL